MSSQSPTIAILGAGVMGLCSAYHLRKDGADITLYDPHGFPHKNASWQAGGMLAPYSEIEHMDERWIAAGLSSIAFWQDFSTTRAIDFSQQGSLLLAHPEDEHMLARFQAHLPSDKRTMRDTVEFEAALSERFSSGLFLAEEAHLDPHPTMHALHNDMPDIKWRQQAAEPEDIAAHYDIVLDCRGYAAADQDKDLRGVKGELAIVYNPEFTLSRPVRLMHPRYPLYIVPRADGHFMIGATMIEAADNQHVSVRSSLELMSALYSLHPSFGDAHITRFAAGIRPAYPNNLPRITYSENIIRANGLFRHGFLLAPVMAQVIAAGLKGEEHLYRSLFEGDMHEHYS